MYCSAGLCEQIEMGALGSLGSHLSSALEGQGDHG